MRIDKEKIMSKYVVCDECGYNNEKKRFNAFGTCLCCGKILDDRIYFRAQMVKRSFNKARTQGKLPTSRNLIF